MKRINEFNRNTADNFDEFFTDNKCETERVLRQDELIKQCKGGKVIELGCGMSYFLPMVKKRFPDSEVWGMDFSKVAIDNMGKMFPDIKWVVGDIFKNNLQGNYYDQVVSGEVLEHLEKPEELIKEMVRICKDGGVVSLSTPHLECPDIWHIWEFNQSEVVKMMEPYGKVESYTIQSDVFKNRSYIIANLYVKK